ncbi:MAG: carboxylesterase family protein, partial [Rhodopirellula bahusiensis]
EDAKLTNAFMDYWVQFAKTGNPNVEGNPNWPTYTTDADQHQIMDADITTASELRRKACDLLDEIRNAGVPKEQVDR